MTIAAVSHHAHTPIHFPKQIGKITSIALKSFQDHVTRPVFDFSIQTISLVIKVVKIPFAYLEYFIHDAKKDSVTRIISYILYGIGDIGSLCVWFDKLKLIDLAQIGAKMGRISVLRPLTKIPLASWLAGLFGISYVFYAIDAVIDLSKGNLDKKHTTIAWLNLINSIVQIAIMILFFASPITYPAQIVLNVISYGFYFATCGLKWNWIKV